MPQRSAAQNSTTAHAREGAHPGGAGDRTPKSHGKVETSERGGRAEIGIQVLQKISTLQITIKPSKKSRNSTKTSGNGIRNSTGESTKIEGFTSGDN